MKSVGAGKEIGSALFGLAGLAMKGVGKAIGNATGSSFITEVGEAAGQITEKTGSTLGQAIDGAASTVVGIATGDEAKTKVGVNELGDAVSTTVTGAVQGIGQVVKDGSSFAKGAWNGDSGLMKESGRRLAKNACVAVIGIGALDFAGAIDVIPDAPIDDSPELLAEVDDDTTPVDASAIKEVEQADVTVEPVDTHQVDPHYVSDHFRSDGQHVSGYWRDGDGDTSTDLSIDEGGGYFRSDPDGSAENNLRNA